MTGTEMMTSLGYRLEDIGGTNFIEAEKLVALNDAQRQVVSMLTNDALVHLQAQEDLDTAATDNNLGGHTYFALPSPSGEALMNRIVKAYDNTNERFIEMVSPAGFETTSSYNYGTLGTLMRNRLYVSTKDSTVASCFLVYIGSPADIADNTNEIENLSDSVQQAIVEMAESLLWRQDNKQTRAATAKQSAIEIITSINQLGV